MTKRKFVLRLEEDKMKALEKWAADEFRSTNGQLEWLITKALNDAGRWKKQPQNEEEQDQENHKKNS
ncbi:MAG: DNA-binding protein [Salinivirgaceae bacterium]